MSARPDLIALERAAYERAPLSQLRAVRVALSLHSWGNSAAEAARLEAVEALIHERLAEACRKRRGGAL